MSTLSLRLPNSLHERLREIAASEGISINQLVTLAAAEKVATILTLDYLEARASRGDLRSFDRLLARVPAVPAAAGDEIPAEARRAPHTAEVRERRARYRVKRKK
jgi:predicted DNA-binding ribbon-helix-helix protein